MITLEHLGRLGMTQLAELPNVRHGERSLVK